MEKLTAEDLFNLQFGDRVYLINYGESYSYRYVGRMPGCERYLIFSEGERLKHLYIAEDKTFKGDWYSGEYNSKFVGERLIEYYENEIESIKRVYIED